MPSTTSYSFGDIVLVPFPFTDQSSSKKRPAVIVRSKSYHRERRDVILMAVTRQPQTATSTAEAEIVDWQGAGLLKPSVFKPVLTTVEPNLIVRKLGRLGQKDAEVLRRILNIILG
jgi:mRNA interferase MazF